MTRMSGSCSRSKRTSSSVVASRCRRGCSAVAAAGKGAKTRWSSATSMVQPISSRVADRRPALMARRMVDLLTPVASVATLAGIAIGRVAVQALHAQAKPRAYVVIEIDVVNQDAFFKEFVPVAVKTIMDQGGKFLARGDALVNIEGPGPLYSKVKRLTVVGIAT